MISNSEKLANMITKMNFCWLIGMALLAFPFSTPIFAQTNTPPANRPVRTRSVDAQSESLKSELEPIFDIDGALRYLALDIVVMSGDGYWLHGSDYNLYVDENDVLHILHHDTNEAFTAQGGNCGRGDEDEASARHATTDPFVSMDDPNKALRQKLLAVPEFRTRYLEYIRDIAMNSLDWEKLAPKIETWRGLIGPDVESDTHKLYSTEQFTTATFGDSQDNPPAETLKGFIQQRREFLLGHPDIKALGEQK